MIEIIGLTKRFKNITAVDNINLNIFDGEIFGLLGPNGAGKSTLIHLLSTIMKPDSGTIRINGIDILKNPYQVRKLISVSFQDPRLDWQLNPIETLKWHGKIWKIPKNELQSRIDELIKLLKLEEYKNIKNWKLSGGTRKKIEVCKVLIVRPEIAVFDEPTAFLDPVMKQIIWDNIKRLKEENGSTVILATNLMHEADILSDRVAIMDKGKIMEVGTPESLKNTVPSANFIIISYESTSTELSIEKIVANLEEFPSIHKVIVENTAEEFNEVVLKIMSNSVKKVSSDILKFFQENRIIIKNFEITTPTLDDVFFHFTKSYLNPGEQSG